MLYPINLFQTFFRIKIFRSATSRKIESIGQLLVIVLFCIEPFSIRNFFIWTFYQIFIYIHIHFLLKVSAILIYQLKSANSVDTCRPFQVNAVTHWCDSAAGFVYCYSKLAGSNSCSVNFPLYTIFKIQGFLWNQWQAWTELLR